MKKLLSLALVMMCLVAVSSGTPPKVMAQDPVCEAMESAEKLACDAATQAHHDLLAGKITREAHDDALDKCMAMKEAMKTCEPS